MTACNFISRESGSALKAASPTRGPTNQGPGVGNDGESFCPGRAIANCAFGEAATADWMFGGYGCVDIWVLKEDWKEEEKEEEGVRSEL